MVKMAVVWNVARCSLVEVDLRFTGAYCLHHQSHRPIRRNIPEDSHIHIRRLESLKSVTALPLWNSGHWLTCGVTQA
jgi:hypothetical protein